MPLTPRTRLGPYEILAPLGAGGMGEVYRATDTKLSRNVALKVLPSKVAHDAERLARFRHEAKTLAQLDHPNIVSIYSVEEFDGIQFLTMQLIDGLTLDRVISESGMPLEKIFEIGMALADALAAAHDKGIVHRDIKPANVMITADGRVKVLDLGLAKDVRTALSGDATVTWVEETRVGMAVGTLPYMSPEQLRAAKVDHHTDIFSLGVVLYEMATGRRPFSGDCSMEISSAILRDTPRPVAELREGLPIGLQHILDRCLAKEIAGRYSSARELREAVERLRRELESGTHRGHHNGGAGPSIAVLPFTNMSADSENEFFADGITEEIINALTHIEDLRVAARTSAFSFKNKHVDLRIVGDQLKVKTVLQGSIRKAGNRVRIMAQLINVADGYHIWSERYDRELKDIFEVQDDISRCIAERLKVALKSGEQPSVNAGTSNLEAYQLCLKGRALFYRRGLDIRRAAQCFERAVVLDSTYAVAWSGLADTRTLLGFWGFERPETTLPLGKQAAARAVELDPLLAEAHCSLACANLLYDWHLPQSEQEFLRARELSPRNVQNLAWYGQFYLVWARGRFDEAIAVIKPAVEIDPLSGYAHAMLSFCYWQSGNGRDAVRWGEAAVKLEESFFTYWALQHAFHADRQFEKAAAAGEMALAVSGRHPFAMSAQAIIFADAGKVAEARAIYAELVARKAATYIPPSHLAIAASAAGESDMAFMHAREAYEIRDPMLIAARHWPDCRRLREDARFNEIFSSMGLE